MDLSLDIETLSTQTNAVVLSIGMVPFEGYEVYKDKSLLFVLDAQDQIDRGRHVSMSTLNWWQEQPHGVWKASTQAGGEIESALDALNYYVISEHIQHVWVKGAHFDAAILLNLAEMYGMNLRIGYRDWRDVRTIRVDPGRDGLTEEQEASMQGQEPHNPVADALRQAYQVINAKKQLGVM